VGGATEPGASRQNRRSRGLYAEGHDPKEGEGCARIMVRAERNAYRVRASAIDEQDLQVLLHLLEHKVLTTHQITSLHFRSLRRCQHRMRDLKEMGLVSSFSVGRGFGEGRAPACWCLTKPGLVEIADAKDVRTSDLPWVPDSSYRTSKMIAHRLGVNAFLLRPRRGLQSPAGPLPGDLAARALGQNQSGRDQARRVRAVPASGRGMRVLP
jgi:Replication-relaxation